MPSAGHNNPPTATKFAGETQDELRKWLVDHPVVENAEHAKAGKLLVDRASDSLKEMEAERAGRVRPLNGQVKTINDQYRQPREQLQTALDVLLKRLDDYATAEEKKRLQAAAKARKKAEAAIEAAQAAARAQEVVAQESAVGVTTDVVEAAEATKDAEREASRLIREAQRAERDTNVRITGGFRRALTRRTTEILEVVDAHEALDELGLTDHIREAILTSARAYRKQFGELPSGVEAQTEKSL